MPSNEGAGKKGEEGQCNLHRKRGKGGEKKVNLLFRPRLILPPTEWGSRPVAKKAR